MRVFSAPFSTHIASGATTLCHCWRIRRADGVVLGFTDHDAPLSFGQTHFLPVSGAQGGELASKLGAQTDTSEIVAVLSSEAISDEDIVLGRFDRAVVETWRVNWADPAVREMLRADTIGEITREDGRFRAELRSAQQAANVRQGRLYQSVCAAFLGAPACGVVLDHPAYKTEALVAALKDGAVKLSGLETYGPDWFSHGHALWTSGERRGITDMVRAQRRSGDADWLEFEHELFQWLKPGDACTLYAGCDRRFSTCREKFANHVNFQGFPHIPGGDFILKYPKPGNPMNGAPLVGAK